MKIMKIMTISIAAVFLLAGCGAKDEANPASNGGANAVPATAPPSAAPQKVQKIIVGTSGTFKDVTFFDDKGNLTGYDIELTKEIDKRLPEYEFEFKTMEFPNILLSLEANKIDLAVNQYEVNPERQAKFLFNDEAYNIWPSKVVVHKDNNTINSIEDLKGKKVITSPGSNGAVWLQDYNKNHGNPFELVFSGSGGTNDIINQIKTGRVDATISSLFQVTGRNRDADAQQKVVGPVLYTSKIYYVLRKDETELKSKIDETLREIKKDGTLAKLSKQWLGEDFTVNE
ncbi:transporter substrate-binding domain-containing protein [Paenibacillus validus]|uniref:transporter substrate-binding domain-containing protein n=1 Tax=Paenibacillus validus TaxID=44253 RepID=UPI000FD7E965|nr:transporter substrate-binding domain-containing protein [Paenibacillus validus]MED4600885.1 transporter substrate-binding domain-containing protein [Paenibacillus validus]MED4606657.1 transporter substrate-binding domain-containing protein [Paenibacillus validus]